MPVVKEKLTAKNVKIAAVAGAFPYSQTFRSIKVAECKMAVDAGADEIDLVMPIGVFLGHDYAIVAEEIRELKEAIGDAHLKVIVESGLLGSNEMIFKASMIAMDAGADFIKTSTGKTISEVILSDLTGKILKQITCSEIFVEIDTNSLPAGVYILRSKIKNEWINIKVTKSY